MKMIGAFLTVCGILSAQAPQAPNPTQQSNASENAARMANGSGPIYRVTVVARTTKAINYNHRSGATRIGFRGTALMPEARGEAKVESKQGVIKIDAQMERLEPATMFGPEYLTYVMWAITPEGRATNVGEQDEAGCYHGVTIFRLNCNRRTLFRGDATQRCSGDGELRQAGYHWNHRTSRRKVRAVTERPVHLERESVRAHASAAR